MFFYYDWTMLLLIPGILLSLWASARVKSAYAKYSRVHASCRMTGAEVAQHMLHSEYDRSSGRNTPFKLIFGCHHAKAFSCFPFFF